MPATALIPQEELLRIRDGKICNSTSTTTSTTTTEMAGFFSLGRVGNPSANYPSPISNLQYQAAEEEEACNSGNNKSANPITTCHHLHHHPNPISSAESLFLCRNDGISHNKGGFEFLQTLQPQTLVQDHISQIRLSKQPSPPSSTMSSADRHHHHDHRQDLYSAAVGLGVVGRSSGYCNLMPPSSSSSTSQMMSCHDCGNQAKKDCAYMRCRTCCRNRGFRCDTHVKSTWVSAGKRREREQQQRQQQQRERDRHHQENSSIKRPRENINSTTFTSGTEVSSNFPSEITSSAVFRCVKLSSYEDGVNGGRDNDDPNHHHGIIAYQTAVTIGGHLFKGFLYDQGLQVDGNAAGEEGGGGSIAQRTPPPALAGLNLTAAASTSSTTTVAVGAAGASVLVPPVPGSLSFLDPSTTTTTLSYPGSAAHHLSSFIECTQFFPNHKP